MLLLLDVVGLLLFKYFFGAFDKNVFWHGINAEYVVGDSHLLQCLCFFK